MTSSPGKFARHLISNQGSERATNDGGKILTFAGKTHVMWQDVTREGYPNRVRSYDQDAGSWTDPVTLDMGIDNHARGVMTVDDDGYLQVVLGGHGSTVRWCQSRRPNDSSQWTEPQAIGVGTYPVFVCAPDGTLLLTLRGQGSERHLRGLDLYRRPPGRKWEQPMRIVKLAAEHGQAYAGFHMQMDAARDGTLHAIVDFYEGADECGRGLHQAVCYARSPDGGLHWERSDGSAVTLPARPEDLDVLARNTRSRHEKLPPPELRNGGIVADSLGRASMFFINHSAAPGLVNLVTADGHGLRSTPVSPHWERVWPDMRALACWTTIREDNALYVLVQLTPYNDEWDDGKPTRAMNMQERSDQRFAWLVSDDGGENFDLQPCLEPGSPYNQPSVEKSVGANAIPSTRSPRVLYFDGTSEYPGGGDYYEEGRSVAEILASGGFRANRVWLAGELGGNDEGAGRDRPWAGVDIEEIGEEDTYCSHMGDD